MPGSESLRFADRSQLARARGGPLSRRQFLIGLALAAGGAVGPSRAASLARPAAGSLSSQEGVIVCGESMQQVLDMAATAEALAITFYYGAITTPGGFFSRLRGEQQGYLRVALDEERFHYTYLLGRGAQPLATAFYFAAGVFGFNGFASFLDAMDAVETASIGLYLAAARRLGEHGETLLAEIVEQMLGVEAEHRAIGRELAQNAPPPPNNLCFERATGACVAWAFEPLRRFLASDPASEGPFELPGDAEITTAVGSSTCTAVPVASAASCQETAADILNIAATAEALGITLYYQAIQSGFFGQLTESRQWYLQAALDEERNHLSFL